MLRRNSEFSTRALLSYNHVLQGGSAQVGTWLKVSSLHIYIACNRRFRHQPFGAETASTWNGQSVVTRQTGHLLCDWSAWFKTTAVVVFRVPGSRSRMVVQVCVPHTNATISWFDLTLINQSGSKVCNEICSKMLTGSGNEVPVRQKGLQSLP